MGVFSNLSHSESSLESSVASLGRSIIGMDEKKTAEYTKAVGQLNDQVEALHNLVSTVRSEVEEKGSVDLRNPAIADPIQKLVETGVHVPVPSDGILAREAAADWAKLVDDQKEMISKRIEQLRFQIPEGLRHLKERLQIIMGILHQIHEIIMMILRGMTSHK